ncbi:hypothetical protein P154DRAFT_528274 [Amniculicola lignicola CBS 123094]|uniref:Uncharacterized protein n=1 Tax=Amniculicola lignicola CBS 123094 TaxID=1392246 RepID=A0A6A5VSA4_9PLEO|nr:hypothetical protein P154DRAFT_528274 [Amniculicola lignicola CBS 123094]
MSEARAPTVLYPLALPALLRAVLTPQPGAAAATTLVVCSSRDVFLRQLLHALESQDGPGSESLQQLVAPTLLNLFTSRHVQVTFCASVQVLLAVLSAYGRQTSQHDTDGGQRLLIVNPLALHAPTPSFSVQGLSRTFAAAVETARRVGAGLVVVECVGLLQTTRYHVDDEELDLRGEPAAEAATDADEDPWEQEVSILNVSAKRFGSGGSERAWAGRTVKVRKVLARWFQFQHVDDHLHNRQEESSGNAPRSSR